VIDTIEAIDAIHAPPPSPCRAARRLTPPPAELGLGRVADYAAGVFVILVLCFGAWMALGLVIG